ncbi:hypothetical protein GPECTOR_39g429 [Gonium pectorale]|uniref:SNF2 N-terminal domain-containing protein n=1 Tax=Gonium pectorale TaxID=33097 RepID=A0A150GBJ5_GONPE|nr:hypothetical protein GPECTOR_39g429 [Gonium pectorale]|eukprot:KXZ46935.1 hypothetical protein GPECTOR_39g429 [Gonium pectorale]
MGKLLYHRLRTEALRAFRDFAIASGSTLPTWALGLSSGALAAPDVPPLIAETFPRLRRLSVAFRDMPMYSDRDKLVRGPCYEAALRGLVGLLGGGTATPSTPAASTAATGARDGEAAPPPPAPPPATPSPSAHSAQGEGADRRPPPLPDLESLQLSELLEADLEVLIAARGRQQLRELDLRFVSGYAHQPETLAELGGFTQLHSLSLELTHKHWPLLPLCKLTGLTRLELDTGGRGFYYHSRGHEPALSTAGLTGLEGLRELVAHDAMVDVSGLRDLPALSRLEVGWLYGWEGQAAAAAGARGGLGSGAPGTSGSAAAGATQLMTTTTGVRRILPPSLRVLKLCFACEGLGLLAALSQQAPEVVEVVHAGALHLHCGCETDLEGVLCAGAQEDLCAALTFLADRTQVAGFRVAFTGGSSKDVILQPAAALPPGGGSPPRSHAAWLTALRRMPALQRLELESIALNGHDLRIIAERLTGLEVLKLFGGTAYPPEELRHLGSMPGLTLLELDVKSCCTRITSRERPYAQTPPQQLAARRQLTDAMVALYGPGGGYQGRVLLDHQCFEQDEHTRQLVAHPELQAALGEDGDETAVVDRQLTNRDETLPQNAHGLRDPAGQVLLLAASGLAELRVGLVRRAPSQGPDVLAVEVAVRLLPAAFGLVVPEQASRAAAKLGDQGTVAAVAAQAAVAEALVDVVELLAEGAGTDGPNGSAHSGEDGAGSAAAAAAGEGAGAGASTSTAGAANGGGADQQQQHHGDGDEASPAHVYGDLRDEVFDIVAPTDWHATHPDPAGLKSKLYRYQQRAVSWMLWRETQPELGPDPEALQGSAAGAGASSSEAASAVAAAAAAAAASHLGDFALQDLSWRRVQLGGGGGQELWVNRFPGGGVRRQPPPLPPRQRVGILADEMGLGKTVEQWKVEIENHSNLKVVVYDGLRWHRQQTEDKEKVLLKEAKKQARLEMERDKEARRQARLQAQREREAKRQARLRARAEGGGGGRKRRRRGGASASAAGADEEAPGGVRKRRRRGDRSSSRDVEFINDDDEDTAEEEDVELEEDGGLVVISEDPDYGDEGNHGQANGHAHEANGGAAASALEPEQSAAAALAGGDGAGPSQPGRRSSRRSSRRPRRYGESDDEDGAADIGGRPADAGRGAAAGAGNAGAAANGNGLATAAAAAAQPVSATAAASSGAAAGGTGRGAAARGGGGGSGAGPSAAAASGQLGPPPPAAPPAGRVTLAARMQRIHQELTAALYAGTALCPASCDPAAEAAEAVQEMLSADVVLTTYTVRVLNEEVYYSPTNRVLVGLRHEKKYAVPESPLLQVYWYRLVLDEAQMVGGSYSNVAVMASKIGALHRWCVTGTPIGPKGLDDIYGLVRVLQYRPYDDEALFKRLIAAPYRSGLAAGHQRLAALLKPIMWRNSKAVAAADHPLPRRMLQEAHLRFSAAEEAFYDVIRKETNRAYREMRSHQRQQAQEHAQEEGAGAGAAAAAPGGAHSRPNHAAVRKRRKDQARGEELEALVRTELHQLRLACVHPKLTSHWRRMSAMLGLGAGGGGGGNGGGGHGAGGALPSIDEVMARLRDQAQLQLQNSERDLCMALNALASRLEATARRVAAMAARRATAGRGSGGEALLLGSPGGEAAADGKRAKKARSTAGAATPGGASAAEGDAGAAAGGEGGGTAAAESESGVSAFRYNASGKTPAELAADADRMFRDCADLLSMGWRVGEDGIEAAAAAEGAADGSEVEADIKAAAASIRAWRFVQAHTAQLLADLLSEHPHLLQTAASTTAAGAAAAAGPSAPAPASVSASAAAGAAAPSPAKGPGSGSAADVAAAAAARVADLRAYVESRVADVRSGADEELRKVVERRDRVRAEIRRLEEQLVEEYETAVSRGLPEGVVSEPRAWLADFRTRLEAARAVEAARRAEQQASAAAGATLALMGREVVALVAGEEAAVNRLRVGLDAAAGSLLVAAALERLRAAERGLRDGHSLQSAVPGDEWQSITVGGVHMMVPPEGLGMAHADPRVAAGAGWALSYAPAVGLLRRVVMGHQEPQPLEAAGRALAHGADLLTVMLVERHLKHPHRMLESRLQEQRKTADSHGTSRLRELGLSALLPALEAVRLRIELLRTERELNTAELQVEVAEHNCGVVTEEVLEATRGGVTGMAGLLRQSEEELRERIEKLKAECEEQRSKKAFFHNQFLEAQSVRRSRQHGKGGSGQGDGSAAATAAGDRPAQAGAAGDMDMDMEGAATGATAAAPAATDGAMTARSGAGGAPTAMEVEAAEAPGTMAAAAGPQPMAVDAGDAAQEAGAGAAGGSGAPAVENGPHRAAAAAAAARARLAAQAAAVQARLDAASGGGGGGPEEDDALACNICKEPFEGDIRVFPCGHYYCAACSSKILADLPMLRRCPTCRAEVRDKDAVMVVAAVGARAAAGAAGGAAADRQRHQMARGACGEVAPPEGPHILSVKIEGADELMVKISALMRRLVWLRDNRPAEKSLVFSQWADALQIVRRGLHDNGIGCVALESGRKTREAVTSFLNDDSCRVFLLSLRQGAAGLTLVRANHVFLLEPSLDPAIEQQAVARVHRIGQTRDVTVTRLLVDGSVEEAVMRMLREKQQLFMESAHHHLGAGPSTSTPGAGPSGARGPGGGGGAVPLLEGGEGEEASLPAPAPRHEVLAGEDVSYLLDAVLA